MSDYKEKLSKAIKEVFKELYEMSQSEFDEEIKKYSYQSRTSTLFYAWNPGLKEKGDD